MHSHIGALLDALAIEIELEDGDLVEGAVVILKVNRKNGGPALILAAEGFSWIERTGALSYAYDAADRDEVWNGEAGT